MADNINFNPVTKRHAFVSVKEKPWHGLGAIVSNTMSAAECIELAGLNYNVIKVPMYADMDYDKVLAQTKAEVCDIPDKKLVYGETIKERLVINPSVYSTIRTDTRQILGSVGRDYVVIDNNEAFEFFDTIVGSHHALYETAGALGNGEVVFITAKIPALIKLGSGNVVDNVERYIVLSNSHDGSKSLEAFVTTIRVVCNNTLAAARNSASCRFRIRHTKNAKDRVQDAHKVLKLEEAVIEAFALNAAKMTTLSLSNEEGMGLIAKSFLTSDENAAITSELNKGVSVKLADFISARKLNLVNDVYTHFKHGPGAELETASNTVWGVYNAVASYYQNGKSYKSESDRMKSLLYGDANNKITKAYAMALDY